jgi:hypothetical protein
MVVGTIFFQIQQKKGFVIELLYMFNIYLVERIKYKGVFISSPKTLQFFGATFKNSDKCRLIIKLIAWAENHETNILIHH